MILRRSATASLLCGCYFLATPNLALAQTAAATAVPAATASTKPLVAQTASLPKTAERWGVRASWQGEQLSLTSVGNSSAAEPDSSLVALPGEAVTMPFVARVLSLRDKQKALWLRWGSDERHYSVVVMGAEIPGRASGIAARKERRQAQADQKAALEDEDGAAGAAQQDEATSSTPPASQLRVVFKGWSSSEGTHLATAELKSGTDLFVMGEDGAQLCGRSVALTSRRLNPRSAKFDLVRISPLGAGERKDALSLAVSDGALAPNEVLIQAQPGLSSPAVDGDRSSVWKQPYQFVEISSGLAASDTWIIETAEALREPAELYVAGVEQVWTVTLPASEGRMYRLQLPTKQSCLGLVQPARAVAIAELMALVPHDKQPSLSELIARLDQPDAGWAARALALGGQEAIAALTRAFSRMGPQGRGRAFTLAQQSKLSAPLLVAIVESGDSEYAQPAAEELLQRGAVASQALASRLAEAPLGALPLMSDTLAALEPMLAMETLLQALQSQDEERRKQSAVALGHVAREHTELRAALAERLEPKSGGSALNAAGELELVIQLYDWLPAQLMAERGTKLAEDASFSAAYRLVGPLAFLATSQPSPRGLLMAWFAEQGPSALSEVQRYALSVRLMEELVDVPMPWLAGSDSASANAESQVETRRQEIRRASLAQLSSENVRVRLAAAQFMKRYPQAAAVPQLEQAMRKDIWPSVRAQSAEALGALLALQSPAAETAVKTPEQLSADERKQLEAQLVRGAKRDKEVEVRRAALRALTHVGSEIARQALRRALKKDDDYLVRAEAALALGRLCDESALSELTSAAQQLSQPGVTERQITLGLAAVTALVQLNPSDLQKRLQPLRSESIPGILRARIISQSTALSHSCPR